MADKRWTRHGSRAAGADGLEPDWPAVCCCSARRVQAAVNRVTRPDDRPTVNAAVAAAGRQIVRSRRPK